MKLKFDGIKYEKIEGQVYEMRLFEEEEIETYLNRLYKVRSKEKTPYDFVEIDSDSTVEKEVAENDEKLYLVRETKSTHDRDKRRETENWKIDCGRAHFDALGVNFEVATNIHEVLAK